MKERFEHFLRAYKKFYKQHEVWFITLKWLAVFGLFYFICSTRLDNDFGWHLVSGNYIRAHGLPSHDIYTYTAQSYRWIDFEWGGDVIDSILYHLGGYNLLAVPYALLWTGALMLLAFRARFLTIFLAVLAMLPYSGIRSVAWSVLGIALTIYILQKSDKKWRLVLPALFIPWANLHAGFIAGLAVIAYYALKELDKKLALIFIISCLATFVNGYGPRLYVEIAHTLFDPAIHNEIKEWARLYIPTASGAFVFIWIFGFLILEKGYIKRFLQLPFLLFLSTLSATRNLPFFALAATMDVDYYIDRFRRSFAKIALPWKALMGSSIIFIVAVAGTGFYNSYFTFNSFYNGYPTQEITYLKQHPCDGHIFNDYNYGGFLIWKLPGVPIYIDGRMVTWTYYMNRYEAIINHPETNYPAQFKQYNIKCVLIGNTETNSPFINLLTSRDWRTVVKADGSMLLLAPTNDYQRISR